MIFVDQLPLPDDAREHIVGGNGTKRREWGRLIFFFFHVFFSVTVTALFCIFAKKFVWQKCAIFRRGCCESWLGPASSPFAHLLMQSVARMLTNHLTSPHLLTQPRAYYYCPIVKLQHIHNKQQFCANRTAALFFYPRPFWSLTSSASFFLFFFPCLS